MEEVTIKDIARICGVGVSTVSRAINNHPDINTETKEKIMKVIGQYQYIPNNSARNLKRQESKTIALLIKGISNPFFLSMLQPLEDAVDKEGFDYMIQRVKDDEDEICIALQLEKEKRLRGIIFLGANYSTKTEELKQLSTPFVFSSLASLQDVDKELYSSVAIDDFKEGYKMTEYLIRLGHNKIALLGGRKKDVSIGSLRLEGYMAALKDYKITYDENLVFHMKEEYDPYSIYNGYTMMKEALEKKSDFTAAFALSDSMAIGAVKAIIDHGKRVPEDYSVAGFDGTTFASFYNPTLTTIEQPATEIITKSVEILFDLIHGKTKHKHILLDANLIEGASTAKLAN